MRPPSGKRRGRPKGSGIPKKPENKSTKGIRISPELWDIVYTSQNPHETVSETLLRLLRSGAQNYIQMRKKAEALEERIELLQLEKTKHYSVEVLNK